MTNRIELDGLEMQPALQEVSVGDTVRTGSNRFPQYAVIALYDDMAWVRDVQTGAYGLTSKAHCKKVESH